MQLTTNLLIFLDSLSHFPISIGAYIILAVPADKQAADIRVTLDGKTLRLRSHQQSGTRVEIELEQPSASLKAGASLKIDLTW